MQVGEYKQTIEREEPVNTGVRTACVKNTNIQSLLHRPPRNMSLPLPANHNGLIVVPAPSPDPVVVGTGRDTSTYAGDNAQVGGAGKPQARSTQQTRVVGFRNVECVVCGVGGGGQPHCRRAGSGNQLVVLNGSACGMFITAGHVVR